MATATVGASAAVAAGNGATGLAVPVEAATGPSGTVLLLAVQARLSAGLLGLDQSDDRPLFNWWSRPV